MTKAGVWWSQRWTDLVTQSRELRVTVRKARIVVRRGRVHDLAVRSGLITAEVEDESGTSHSVRLRHRPIDDEVWRSAVECLGKEAGHAAWLLSGRISEDIIHLFDKEGADIFPYDYRDLACFCSCLNDTEMCVHAVAVHFAFSDAMAGDPFILLEFRGRGREQLMAELKAHTSAHLADEGFGQQEGPELDDVKSLANGYWEAGEVPHLAFRWTGASGSEEEALPVVRALGPGPAETPPEIIADVLSPLVSFAGRRLAQIIDKVAEEEVALLPESIQDEKSMDEVLVAAAHQHGELTSAFVAEALGIGKPEAQRYLQWMVSQGRLAVIGQKRATKYVPVESGPVEGEVAG
jgi:uncharacterized Zn finger protein